MLQVHAIFDRRLAAALLKQLRILCGSQYISASSKGTPDDAAMDIDQHPQGLEYARAILNHLAKFLLKFGLRDQPDTVKDIAETVCDIAVSRKTPGRSLLAEILYSCI